MSEFFISQIIHFYFDVKGGCGNISSLYIHILYVSSNLKFQFKQHTKESIIIFTPTLLFIKHFSA